MWVHLSHWIACAG